MNASASRHRLIAAVVAFGLTLGVTGLTLTNPSSAAITQTSYDIVVHVPVATLPADASIQVYSPTNLTTSLATSRLTTLDNYGWWGIVTVPAGSTLLCFSATGLPKSATCTNPSSSHQVWLDANGVPSLTRVAAAKNIKIHLATSNKTARYAVVNVEGTNYSQLFVKVGTSDLVATVSVPATTTTYTVKTQFTKSKKLFDDFNPVEGDASLLSEVYLTNGMDTLFSSVAQRSNVVLIHYHRDDNVYKSWGLHTWYDDSFGGAYTPTTWARAKSPQSSKPDSWGVTFSVPLASFSSKLPYMIHKANIKDPAEGNQYVDLETMGNEIWIESGKIGSDGGFVVAYPQKPGADPISQELSVQEATALTTDSARSSFANDSIYFVMTDRYKNGNTANDTGGLNSTNRNLTGFAPNDSSWSHGGDLAGLSDGCSKQDGSGEGLPRIKAMGFGAVWITPPFKQNFVQGSSASYHGYWINDFTTIDPHWGTNAEFKSFVDCAHRLGMKVVVDIVMNHTGDVISYRDGSYGFHNSPNTSASVPSWGTNIKAPAWLNDINNYHNQGNVSDWGNQSQYQNGDFFGLDDIKTENDVVINGFADVYSTWVNDFGVDGFRIDTAKHVDDAFFSKWWPKIVSQTNASMISKNQKLFAFGEYYDGNTTTLSKFERKYGLPSVLDFAFQNNALSFAGGSTASNLSNVLEKDNNFITQDKSAYNLVTFLGNHDMGRAAMLLNQSGTTRSQSLLLAHDVMFLTRGIPSVYYGDEVGMIGNGGDKGARQDMFPTQVSQWQSEDRAFGSSIGTGSSLTLTTPLTTRITTLNNLRKLYPALATGSQTTRLTDANVLALSRFDKTDRREFLVAFNSGNSAKTVKITSATPSSSWTALLTGSTVTSNALGEVSITVPARGTVIYRASSTLPVASPTTPVTVRVQVSSGDQSILLDSTATSQDLGAVTFAVQKGNGVWSAIGTDDSRGFGMKWDYQPNVGPGLVKGTKLNFVAIYKSSSGTVSLSGVSSVVIP